MVWIRITYDTGWETGFLWRAIHPDSLKKNVNNEPTHHNHLQNGKSWYFPQFYNVGFIKQWSYFFYWLTALIVKVWHFNCVWTMALVLDGNSDHVTHAWRKMVWERSDLWVRSILSNFVELSNNRNCSLRAHLYRGYHLI